MTCELCRRYAKLYSDDYECAFPNGTFSSDNVDCVSMIYLRALCDDLSKTPNYYFNNDRFLGVVPFCSKQDDDGNFYYPAFIVLSWYKHRCNTGTAMWISDDNSPRLLKESDIKMLIKYRGDDVAEVLGVGKEGKER